MNRIFLVFLALIISQILGAQVYYGSDANALVNGASTVRISKSNDAPDFIKFQNPYLNEVNLESCMRERFSLDARFKWKLMSEFTDKLGENHKRYKLYFNY